MIAWFNANQGFVMSLLTAVYVIATLVILWMMTRSNRLSSEAIATSQELHHEQTRPYVVFDIVCRDRMIYADLQNFGQRPAFNVRVSLDPPLPSRSNGDTSPLLELPIGMLPPGRVISDLLDSSAEFHQSHPMAYTVAVKFEDRTGRMFSEKCTLDLRYYVESRHIVEHEVGDELHKIEQTLGAQLRSLTEAINAVRKDA